MLLQLTLLELLVVFTAITYLVIQLDHLPLDSGHGPSGISGSQMVAQLGFVAFHSETVSIPPVPSTHKGKDSRWSYGEAL